MSYMQDPRRARPQKFAAASRAFVLADGSTVRLVAAKRNAVPFQLPNCPFLLPLNGVIAGIARRPRFWFTGLQKTTIAPLPAFMPPYQVGATYAFTPDAATLKSWIETFEASCHPRRAPLLPLSPLARYLLGS